MVNGDKFVLYNTRLRKYLTKSNGVSNIMNSRTFTEKSEAVSVQDLLPMRKEWLVKEIDGDYKIVEN